VDAEPRRQGGEGALAEGRRCLGYFNIFPTHVQVVKGVPRTILNSSNRGCDEDPSGQIGVAFEEGARLDSEDAIRRTNGTGSGKKNVAVYLLGV